MDYFRFWYTFWTESARAKEKESEQKRIEIRYGIGRMQAMKSRATTMSRQERDGANKERDFACVLWMSASKRVHVCMCRYLNSNIVRSRWILSYRIKTISSPRYIYISYMYIYKRRLYDSAFATRFANNQCYRISIPLLRYYSFALGWRQPQLKTLYSLFFLANTLFHISFILFHSFVTYSTMNIPKGTCTALCAHVCVFMLFITKREKPND